MEGIEKTKRGAMNASFAQKKNGSKHYVKLIHME